MAGNYTFEDKSKRSVGMSLPGWSWVVELGDAFKIDNIGQDSKYQFPFRTHERITKELRYFP